MGILQSLREKQFTCIVEFTPHSRADVQRMAEVSRDLAALNDKYASKGVKIAGVALTQNPGGSLAYEHHAALAVLNEKGMGEGIEAMPHITGKEMNADALRTILRALAEAGVTTILALTGDVPGSAQGVFELDSLGILELANEISYSLLKKARNPEQMAQIPVLNAGAAVSPFKYTEGSLAMQLIKASKKVRAGAAFLICQSGWDAERSEFLLNELQVENTPLIGNVQVVNYVAARFMRSLPGCVISDPFLERLRGETADDAQERASQQAAMFRGLGYAGIHIGKPGDFQSAEEVEAILDRALEIPDWREHKENLTFPMPERPAPLLRSSASVSKAVHNLVFDEAGALHGIARAALSPFNRSAEREGGLYRLFKGWEAMGKGVLYQCENCGDCFLPENQYVCTIGECEKGLNNPPCGDADPTGICGNNPNRVCVGEKLYYRLVHYKALDSFKRTILPPRDYALRNTASVLNYFFNRDHATKPNPLASSGLIQIGELLHATIPFPGAAMRLMLEAGDKAFSESNKGRLVVEHLIADQARQGANYLDVNLDALGAPNAPDLMRGFVRMIREHGCGVPPCVDSSDVAVLRAGLEEWFALSDAAKQNGGETIRPPLVNSIPFVEREKFRPLIAMRADRPFGIVCLLVGMAGPLKSPDEMFEAAREMFSLATEAGFQPGDIFFDTVTLGIASDGCMDAMGNIKASHTRNSFLAIERIRKDPTMKGVHALLGVSNWTFGAQRRRIGHIRAFIAAAQKYGLDAVIADVEKEFGLREAAPELVEFVEMFVGLDGGEESMLTYSAEMQKARQAGWI
ncbi:methylenetetrahydrofolate reductase C-terminal domain-containing protein [Candidatus Sumerlaeota bacterium]|nr:methylenetetrahydrofolate reductase C-terminal domain-containing protein [Candidatus Sumerlaeota bacterium]